MRHESSFYEFMLEKNAGKIVVIRHDVYWFVANRKKHLGGKWSEGKIAITLSRFDTASPYEWYLRL